MRGSWSHLRKGGGGSQSKWESSTLTWGRYLFALDWSQKMSCNPPSIVQEGKATVTFILRGFIDTLSNQIKL